MTSVSNKIFPSSLMLRMAGICAILSALTTFLLWYLPRTYNVASGFEGSIALHAEPAYMARLWINFWHVFLALFAYGVLAAILARQKPGWAAIGFIAFLIWAITESLAVSINIWAVNETWRPEYLQAGETEQLLLQASLKTFSGIWQGLFFVILVTFLIGTLSFGMALWTPDPWRKVLSILFLLAVPLTVIIIFDTYFGAHLSRWISWSYPVLQPFSRALLGVWLIKISSHQIS